MSGECSGGHAESGSVGSSQESIWQEKRQKRRENREHERREEEFGLRKGSNQIHRTMSGTSGHRQFDEKDQELEQLCRLVKDLELEARGWRQGRDRDNQERKDGSMGNRGEDESNQSDSRRRRDHSHS